MQRSFVLSIIIVALLLAGLIYYLHALEMGFSIMPLMVGNIILAGVSLLSFFIISKGIHSDNANAFVRAKMTGTLLKFFVCIAALLVYIFVNERAIHKPSLFLFIGMYVVYSAIEAVPLSRLAKKN
jgi:hypothetical protein